MVSPNRPLDLLSRVPLLRALPADLRQALAAALEERIYGPGERIFDRGDPGDRMYIVAEGEVQIDLPAEAGATPTVLRHLFPGDYFGELALLDGGGRTAGALAIAHVRLLALSRDAFLTTALGSRSASLLVMQELTARLRNTTTILAQRASRDFVRELDASATRAERFANRVANWNGSWSFIVLVSLLSASWMGFNAIRSVAFDPYPYVFFNLVLAILVVLQGPLLMMAQNRENRHERARAESDYRVNLKNELAIERLAQELTALRTELIDRSRRISAVPAERTRPPPGEPGDGSAARSR